MLVVAVLDRAAEPSIARFDLLKLRLKANVDALFFENVKNDFSGGGIIFVHDLITTLQNGNFGAKPAHGMSQFATDRTATNYHKVFGKFGQFKERFAGQAIVSKSRDIWNEGPPAGTNHRSTKFDFFAVQVKRVGAGEFGVSK